MWPFASAEVRDERGFAKLYVLCHSVSDPWRGRSRKWLSPCQALRAQPFTQTSLQTITTPQSRVCLLFFRSSPVCGVSRDGLGLGTTSSRSVGPRTEGPRAQEQAVNPFPLLSCRNTMSSTPPWPGARPTPRGLMACGPAWCTWSRCAPAPWPAMESSVARCASRPWRTVRGRRVTWITAGSRGRRSPQEAVVTAEMPAANWIPVELPQKGLPPGGPAFTRQNICLKPGRVFDI